MKEKLKRAAEKMKVVFGYGIMSALMLGGLTFVGYVAALVIGGETAALICKVIYKQIVPVMINASTVLVLFGLLTMYLAGEKSLTTGKKKP